MNRKKVFFWVLTILASLLITTFATVHARPDFSQQSAEDLYQSALMKKEAEGDLKGAIRLFQDILTKFPGKRDIAAKAQLQIGICLEKLGTKEAEKAFQKVIDNYPEQSDAVREAKEKLSLLLKSEPSLKQEMLNLKSVRYGRAPEWISWAPSPPTAGFSPLWIGRPATWLSGNSARERTAA